LYSNVVLFVVWLRIYCQAPFRCTSIHLLWATWPATRLSSNLRMLIF
jgi:hypothetical protein